MNPRWMPTLINAGVGALIAVGSAHTAVLAQQQPPRIHTHPSYERLIEQAIADFKKEAGATPQGQQEKAFIGLALRWAPEKVRNLKVCFFQTDAGLQRQIAAIASEWSGSNKTGLHFDFGSSDFINGAMRSCEKEAADIRIGNNPDDQDGEYWSVLGNLAAGVSPANYTMNLAFSSGDLSPAGHDYFRFLVLHEFGHALGFLHEHQESLCDGEFNKDQIMHDTGWSAEKVDANFDQIPDSSEFNPVALVPYDNASTMRYWFPETWLKRGNVSPCYIAKVTVLSDGDKRGIAMTYPAGAKAPPAGMRQLAAGVLASTSAAATTKTIVGSAFPNLNTSASRSAAAPRPPGAPPLAAPSAKLIETLNVISAKVK